MSDEATKNVSEFYNNIGWKIDDGITEDARRWEDLRECASAYVAKCRMRVARHIPASGDAILDMASGPIQYHEYLEYSRNFKKRYCVDLSAEALRLAKRRIGSHGTYLHGDFLEIDDLREDFFDCSISLHTIYHIDRDRQEAAVRKLLRVTKPGHRVIIVYSNPKSYIRRLMSPARFALSVGRKLKSATLRSPTSPGKEAGPYFHSYGLDWWQRFDDVSEVRILPWRSFGTVEQKKLFPNNRLGRGMFAVLFWLEDRFPNFFAAHFQYPMIVMTKRVFSSSSNVPPRPARSSKQNCETRRSK
jgi:ubiquinone/menaquinone biosynthesis C-methylase UbiE